MAGYICGFYYTIPNRHCWGHVIPRYYLPQIDLQAHTTILSTTSRTKLTQTFVNPSEKKGIKEVRYTFPLYDGVSVVAFTCRVGDRIIIGEVKEKEQAKKVFQQAVARGETAGLLEQLPDASDIFTTTIGNVPAGAKLVVEITYLGELKHDAEVDGVRFTIPTVIVPRYGSYPGELVQGAFRTVQGKGIQITVDAEMAEGSFIQQMRSPSHPIAVSMGTTSIAPNAEPQMSRASATLSLGSAELDTDFVLQVVAKDTGVPKAILETHPTIPNQRALMATLVPKFSLPAEKPEIVFICDRSGSMAGSKIPLVISALKVFLKSIPLGVKFNICSFGSSYSFLWPKSKTYSQSSLDEAVRHVETFQANFGGTEMYQPIKATLEQRYKDIPLEVMLLTDGEIWDQQTLFTYLNKEVIESKAPIRVFTLGIGNGVSHALIEGVAKAGNGFSQAVGEGEKLDSKVVRMLKGALSPHINDYTLEVKYVNGDATTSIYDDEFEIVEKVVDSLRVKLNLSDETKAKEEKKKPISLFDTSVNLDKEEPATVADESGEARYAHLPSISVPKLLQAPHIIPPLFPFNRTSVYLLMGPDSVQKKPKSVVLRGTSIHGPLELEIPVQVLDIPGETIHQLAAKKAIAELEQGRGWITEARDESGNLLKEEFESRYEDMVEREAVRLGVQFQVGGKWCSFVAVESNKANQSRDDAGMTEVEWLDASVEVEETEMAGEGYQVYDRSHTRGGLFGGRGGRGAAPGGRGARQSPDERGSPKRKMAASPRYSGMGTAPLQPQMTGMPAQMTGMPAQLTGMPAQMTGMPAQMTGFGASRHSFSPLPSMALGASPSPFGAPAANNVSSSSYAAPGAGVNSCIPIQQAQARSRTGRPQALPHSAAPQRQMRSSLSITTPLFGSTQTAASYSDGSEEDLMDIDATESTQAISRAMSANIDRVAQRGEHLSMLVDQSDALSSSSKMFYTARHNHSLSRIFGGGLGGLFGGPAQSAATPSASSESQKRKEKSATSPPAPKRTVPTGPKLDVLIDLQTFEGFWELDPVLLATVGVSETQAAKMATENGWDRKVVATALAVAFFEKKLGGEKDAWELVVEKAKGWLEEQVQGTVDVVELIGKVGGLVE
ncbi:VIT-domain-containing protein [Lepidopterella palustris CBS 459.81]|uniref:VIT-domain-containing protein n=1 Tax=Lepidopterella palustris CBS 459.81 TaxID=1314670 RepID=A0A8E2EKI4_9PEZI|nr:VIT-domain-containing protein [Lepidopterella palustris CBS 459.81]